MLHIKKVPKRLMKALLGSSLLTLLLVAPAYAQQPKLHTTNNYPGHQTVTNVGDVALTVFTIIALIGVVVPAGLLGWHAWKGNDIDSGRMWRVLGLSLLGLYILGNLGGFTQSVTGWIKI